jgi:hypothetical protein
LGILRILLLNPRTNYCYFRIQGDRETSPEREN